MLKLKDRLKALVAGKKLTSALWNDGCYLTITTNGDLVFVYYDHTGHIYESVLKESHFLELITKTDGVLDEN
jgi:hypothetical protein